MISECTTNDDCSGASDTCKFNICYCGSTNKCTGGADTCTSGKCKCGENDECSSQEVCALGKCVGMQFPVYTIFMIMYYISNQMPIWRPTFLFFCSGLRLSGTCTGSYDNVTSSYITSPNYPLNYGNNVKCRWTTVAPNERIIALNVTDFVIQEVAGDRTKTDSLSIYNGPNVTILTGSKDPFVIYTGKTTHLEFTSDESTAKKGFKIFLKTYGS